MTPTDKTAPGQSGSIILECELPHAPEKVWRALTDPVLLSQWLLPVIALKLEPGSSFTFTAPPQPGWDGRVSCRLLAIEKPRKLTYAWVVGDLDTIVTFTLAATASGTCMTIEQSGFTPHQKQNFGGARYGWKMMGGRLFDLLDGLS